MDNMLAKLVSSEASGTEKAGSGMVRRAKSVIEIDRAYKQYVMAEQTEGRDPSDRATFAKQMGYL